MQITIHLYRLDPAIDPPTQLDIGIRPIVLPAQDLAVAAKLAETAFINRLGRGLRSPTAGHVEDDNGEEILALALDEAGKIVVERREA